MSRAPSRVLEVWVDHTWNGAPISDTERARVEIEWGAGDLCVRVEAPFNGDVAPESTAGRTPRLWEHEVVELFLLGEDDRYLELELGPHGHYLALSLHGARNLVTDSIEVDYTATIEAGSGRWRGVALVAAKWLPPGLARINAYAICGAGSERRHMAAFPVPGASPDFHRLEHFARISELASNGPIG